jgi:hypothetical protein
VPSPHVGLLPRVSLPILCLMRVCAGMGCQEPGLTCVAPWPSTKRHRDLGAWQEPLLCVPWHSFTSTGSQTSSPVICLLLQSCTMPPQPLETRPRSSPWAFSTPTACLALQRATCSRTCITTCRQWVGMVLPARRWATGTRRASRYQSPAPQLCSTTAPHPPSRWTST